MLQEGRFLILAVEAKYRLESAAKHWQNYNETKIESIKLRVG